MNIILNQVLPLPIHCSRTMPKNGHRALNKHPQVSSRLLERKSPPLFRLQTKMPRATLRKLKPRCHHRAQVNKGAKFKWEGKLFDGGEGINRRSKTVSCIRRSCLLAQWTNPRFHRS